jgi:hypothetical protein
MSHKMGVGWYRKEQWDKLRSVSADANNLEKAYEEWQANAENVLLSLRAGGADAVKVEIDVEELIRWCQEKKRAVNSKSRSEFVVQQLMRSEQ